MIQEKQKRSFDFSQSQFKLINRNSNKEERGWFHDFSERTCARNMLRLINYKPGLSREAKMRRVSMNHRWNVSGNAKCRDAEENGASDIFEGKTHLQHKSGTFSWILRLHVQQDDAILSLYAIQQSMLQHFFLRTFSSAFNFTIFTIFRLFLLSFFFLFLFESSSNECLTYNNKLLNTKRW